MTLYETPAPFRGKERRNEVRKTVGFPAAIIRVNKITPANNQNKWDHEVGYNIGPGGMCLTCEKRLPAKANVTVVILLPDEDNDLMQVEAKLAWTKRCAYGKKKLYCMGFEFTKLNPETQKQIQQYIDEPR